MYIDINWEARTNGRFRHKLDTLVNEIARLEKIGSPAAEDKIKNLTVEIYRLCHHNPGFLIPYFFPKFHPQDRFGEPNPTPLSLQDRPYAFAIFYFQIGGFIVFRASRQIGKSTSIACRQLINAHIVKKYKSLYITPHQEFLTTYANRLKDMEREFRFQRTNPDLRSNLKYKEQDNGSTITLVKCLTDSAEARSKTADELLYDEYQLLDPDLEPDIEQTQKASSMPSTVYAGTSTTIESPLECRFQESSMGMWHIKSPDGKHWINCGDEEEILKVIKPEGPT